MSRCEHSQRNEISIALRAELNLSTPRQAITLKQFQDFVIIGVTLKGIDTFKFKLWINRG